MTAKTRIRPDKKELAQIKTLSDLGLTPTAIDKKIGRSHHTVIKYLNSEVYNDPEIMRIVDLIKEKELADLYLLGAKSRKRLHELLDEGKTKRIETVAVMDRTFQQRRLLEGASTQNIDIHTLNADIKELELLEQQLTEAIQKRRAQPEDVKDNAY